MRVRIINPNLQPKKLKVCAYCRVSTNSDEQALSLENQTSTYERLIKSNPEYEFAGVYHDKAMTGSKEKRQGFQKMLSDAKAGKINLIITKSISRFARNTVTVLKYSRELREIGVGIFFEEEKINTLSSDGEVMLSTIAAIAEDELRSMSENIKWSIHKKFQRGELIISTKYFLGYDKNQYGQLIINEKQAELVRRIFNLYIGGMSTEKIADLLNSEKVPTIKNGKWHSSTINIIIKNEKYKGDCILQKTYHPEINKQAKNKGNVTSWYIEDNHPPIVTKEIWEKANILMAERSKNRNPAVYSKRYPLSGLLICPYCGSTLRRKQVHNKRIEWWCSKSIKEGVKSCKGIHVRNEDVVMQNITEPTVVEEMIVDGKKHYSYTCKSDFNENCKKPKQEVENGGLLQGIHRPRRTIIKL
ncbi:MAG: recombinase family protein [Clostridia bacterium]|nr:recombinase family protein [Clostridia bacterium]